MGKLLPSFKKTVVDEIVNGITTGSSTYYAFAANPVAYTDGIPSINSDDYTNVFINDWNMLLGKKLTASDVAIVIKKNAWTSGNVYDRYDNTNNVTDNDNFYVISQPVSIGGVYNVYKCIDNNKGAASTVDPGTIGTPTQASSFVTLADGYRWRYIFSISSANYDKFASTNFVPVFANASLSSTAANRAGVEVVAITNAGNGYSSYTSGQVQSVVNSTVIQLESSASNQADFYNKNGIYLYNSLSSTSEIREVTDYYISGVGGEKFVVLSAPINVTNISSGVTEYRISPKVVFNTDGTTDPTAYSVVNTTSNSIGSIVILDIGSNISWANVSVQSNSTYGTGAQMYAIVPPAGGHGADPASELNAKGMAVSFKFANTESGAVVTSNATFNKIGIVKNPYSANSLGGKTSTLYTADAFNQILKADVSPSYTFAKGDVVLGYTSGARGTVVFSNSSVVYLSGDKNFTQGEFLTDVSGTQVTQIDLNTRGDIYTKDLKPLYIQNINNVNRSNTQTESFGLTIQL